jgi:hypothetical protein
VIAEEILQRLRATYASARSYADRGVVTTTFHYPSRDRVTHRPFETAFVRPDRFRFELRDDDERYVVWTERGRVRTAWTIAPGLDPCMNLGLALAGATGVSGGSAHTVPTLLMSDRVRGLRQVGDRMSRPDGFTVDTVASYEPALDLALDDAAFEVDL